MKFPRLGCQPVLRVQFCRPSFEVAFQATWQLSRCSRPFGNYKSRFISVENPV